MHASAHVARPKSRELKRGVSDLLGPTSHVRTLQVDHVETCGVDCWLAATGAWTFVRTHPSIRASIQRTLHQRARDCVNVREQATKKRDMAEGNKKKAVTFTSVLRRLSSKTEPSSRCSDRHLDPEFCRIMTRISTSPLMNCNASANSPLDPGFAWSSPSSAAAISSGIAPTRTACGNVAVNRTMSLAYGCWPGRYSGRWAALITSQANS